MNRAFRSIVGGRANKPESDGTPKIKTSSPTLDWCKDFCKDRGYQLYPDTLIKEYTIYDKSGEVVGRYDTLKEVIDAIKAGTIFERHNI